MTGPIKIFRFDGSSPSALRKLDEHLISRGLEKYSIEEVMGADPSDPLSGFPGEELPDEDNMDGDFE